MDKTKFPQNPDVEAFKQNILKTAEDMVARKFPNRIIELNKLLTSSKLTTHPSSVYQKINIPIPEPSNPTGKAPQESTQDHNGEAGPTAAKRSCPTHQDQVTIGTKVLMLPDGVVQSNPMIVELIDIIKPLIGELVEDTNMLKMWLVYLIPRIEDGNNFGVSIQEDVLAEIRASEGEAAAYYDQISRYFSIRGKTVAKVAQYPHIDDYRRSIQELDEKEFFSLRLIVAELRNHYATLHDLISKNSDKIRKPRSSNADHMF